MLHYNKLSYKNETQCFNFISASASYLIECNKVINQSAVKAKIDDVEEDFMDGICQ